MELSERFKNGLNELGIENLEEYKYCGGDTGEHLAYFNLFFKNNPIEQPTKIYSCNICNQYIIKNYYITNGEKLLIVGSCCMKKFIPMSYRTCENCEERHRNRKTNLCNNCKHLCNDCVKLINKEKKIECYCDEYIKFGKYKYMNYKDILKKDKNYLNWLLNQEWFNEKKILEYYLNN